MTVCYHGNCVLVNFCLCCMMYLMDGNQLSAIMESCICNTMN